MTGGGTADILCVIFRVCFGLPNPNFGSSQKASACVWKYLQSDLFSFASLSILSKKLNCDLILGLSNICIS